MRYRAVGGSQLRQWLEQIDVPQPAQRIIIQQAFKSSTAISYVAVLWKPDLEHGIERRRRHC